MYFMGILIISQLPRGWTTKMMSFFRSEQRKPYDEHKRQNYNFEILVEPS